jgi:hypothetical protein
MEEYWTGFKSVLIITDDDVWFIIADGSVSVHFLNNNNSYYIIII